MAKLSRKQFLVYVDCADYTESSATADYALIGIGSEEVNLEYNYNKESVTDIYGVTRGSVHPGEKTITIDSNMEISGDKLFKRLLALDKAGDFIGMSQFKVLVVYGFDPKTVTSESATTTVYPAELHSGCTVTLSSLGGSSDDLNAPYEITLSDDKVLGTVASNDWRQTAPTFTPDTN